MHQELGPDYGDAVVESFLAKIDKQIEARVDERLAGLTGQSRLARRRRPADPVRLAKLRIAVTSFVAGSMVTGVPLTIIFVKAGGTPSPDSGAVVLFLWAVLVVIYGLAAVRLRRR